MFSNYIPGVLYKELIKCITLSLYLHYNATYIIMQVLLTNNLYNYVCIIYFNEM